MNIIFFVQELQTVGFRPRSQFDWWFSLWYFFVHLFRYSFLPCTEIVSRHNYNEIFCDPFSMKLHYCWLTEIKILTAKVDLARSVEAWLTNHSAETSSLPHAFVAKFSIVPWFHRIERELRWPCLPTSSDFLWGRLRLLTSKKFLACFKL